MGSIEEAYRRFGDSCSGAYPPEDFEGLWVERWPNGELKFRGLFKKHRKRIGQHISFWENGTLQELSYWDEGWVCGTLIRFNEDGSKECEKDFGQYGGSTRSWTETCYSRNGGPSFITVSRNGQFIAQWTHPELRKIEEKIGQENIDRIIDDAVKMVYPDKQ